MERRGSGLRKILESYEHEHKYKKELKPEFISTQSSFVVILKNLNYYLGNEPQNEPQKIQNKRGLRNLKRLLHMSLKSLWLKSQKYWVFLKQP